MKQLNVRYSCAKNIYQRTIKSNVTKFSRGWRDWAFHAENIFRVKSDNKTVYLSRTENSTDGLIEWKFYLGSSSAKSIDLRFETTTFEDGIVDFQFIDLYGLQVSSKDRLIGSNEFTFRVFLHGGNGENAWQNAQLFRQLQDADDYPFQVTVKLF